MNQKNFLVVFFLSLMPSIIFANPCEDFIDFQNQPEELYFEAEDKLCVIDVHLAKRLKFSQRQHVQTDQGSLEFLISENGNMAIVGDVLAMSGRVNINHPIDRVVREAIRDVIDCVREPACREMVRD